MPERAGGKVPPARRLPGALFSFRNACGIFSALGDPAVAPGSGAHEAPGGALPPVPVSTTIGRPFLRREVAGVRPGCIAVHQLASREKGRDSGW